MRSREQNAELRTREHLTPDEVEAPNDQFLLWPSFIEALAAGILDSRSVTPLKQGNRCSKFPDVAMPDLDDDHAQVGRSSI